MNNILSSYKDYRKSGGTTEVTRGEYCKVVNDFNKHIMDFVFNGHEVRLPERLGTISVKGKKVITEFDEETGEISNQSIDFGETNKLWARCPECKDRRQKVYHLNEHTNGVRYRFFWSKDRVLVENKLFYTMIFTRTNKRDLSHLIQQGKEYYIEPIKLKL
jgi:hypothetical protein